MDGDSSQTFTISAVRPCLLAVAILTVPALIAGVAVGAATGQGGTLVGAALGWAAASAIVLIPILLIAPLVRWDAGPDGVGGRDNYLVYRRVAWPDIASVSPVPIPGYRYVWVHTASKRKAFWLPLFLTDMAGFRAAVARHAEPENPLRRYLEDKIPPVT